MNGPSRAPPGPAPRQPVRSGHRLRRPAGSRDASSGCDVDLGIGGQPAVRAGVVSGGLVGLLAPAGIDREVEALGQLVQVAFVVVEGGDQQRDVVIGGGCGGGELLVGVQGQVTEPFST